MKPRRAKPGAFALDCRGSILHHDSSITDYNDRLLRMSRDVELQMLGMVEIRVVHPKSFREWYFPITYYDPYFLYQHWSYSR